MQDTRIESFLSKRSDNFLLLRIIAAIAVIYGHSFALVKPDGSQDIFLSHHWGIYSGDIAVDIFFVVSGFMVSGSFITRSDFWDYSKARLLRIVPAYLVLLIALGYVLGPVLSSLSFGKYFSDPSVFAYITKNIRFTSDMAWTLPGVFADHKMTSVNGSLWTLPAEMRMYVLVAALGVLGLLKSRTFGVIVVAGLLVVGKLWPSMLSLHPDWFRLAAFFCLGILAQLWKNRIHVTHSAMLMLTFITYISINTDSYRYLLALSIAYFCFWFAYRTPVFRHLQRCGDPSYGIYLWGWPIQQMLVQAMPDAHPWQNFIGSAVIASAIGYLSWFVIEKPALRLKSLDLRSVFHRSQLSRSANGEV